ncbi:MAG TPA: DUF1707 and DUF4190 domain-containing protein [Streptosporangiaceae bacterium]
MTIRQGYGMAGGGGLRASDADRERAVEVLKTGYAEGRMPKDEYDARVGQAYTVPTRADLELVTAQLPGGGPVLYATGGRRLNQLAVASLACGVGQPFTAGLSTIPAIVLGHLARRQIRRTGEDGAGLALSGLILGWVGAALIALIITVVVVAAIALTNGAPSSG